MAYIMMNILIPFPLFAPLNLMNIRVIVYIKHFDQQFQNRIKIVKFQLKNQLNEKKFKIFITK